MCSWCAGASGVTKSYNELSAGPIDRGRRWILHPIRRGCHTERIPSSSARSFRYNHLGSERRKTGIVFSFRAAQTAATHRTHHSRSCARSLIYQIIVASPLDILKPTNRRRIIRRRFISTTVSDPGYASELCARLTPFVDVGAMASCRKTIYQWQPFSSARRQT